MENIEQLTEETLSDDQYEEIWEASISGGGKYQLSKNQAHLLMQEMANGNRGVIPFKTFVISIPYVTEFYRTKRFLKDTYQLPAQASEKPYDPIPADKWEELKKDIYKKIGKRI